MVHSAFIVSASWQNHSTFGLAQTSDSIGTAATGLASATHGPRDEMVELPSRPS
jgi:hypothetical protein